MIGIPELLATIDHIDFIGSKSAQIEKPVQANSKDIGVNDLTWVSDKNLGMLGTIPAGTILCSDKVSGMTLNPHCNYIIVSNPRNAFRKVLENFFMEKEEPFISPSAQIHPSCKIGDGVFIGHGVVLEKDCIIGDHSSIGHNTVLKSKTLIGRSVKIGSNCTIGGVGFGYEKDEDGHYQFIPHLGNVVINDNVDIGNCTAIDRAVMGSTFIGSNCKIDNLVHIAHGVQLGKNSLVIANAMVAGSVVVGENVWVAPSSSILNNKTIGDNATIGMGAVVLKSVDQGATIIGNPGRVLPK